LRCESISNAASNDVAAADAEQERLRGKRGGGEAVSEQIELAECSHVDNSDDDAENATAGSSSARRSNQK
jgi:hypothetical protein